MITSLPPPPEPDARDLELGLAFAQGIAFGRVLERNATTPVAINITITRVRPRAFPAKPGETEKHDDLPSAR